MNEALRHDADECVESPLRSEAAAEPPGRHGGDAELAVDGVLRGPDSRTGERRLHQLADPLLEHEQVEYDVAGGRADLSLGGGNHGEIVRVRNIFPT